MDQRIRCFPISLTLQSFHLPTSLSLPDVPFIEMCCLEKTPTCPESHPPWLTWLKMLILRVLGVLLNSLPQYSLFIICKLNSTACDGIKEEPVKPREVSIDLEVTCWQGENQLLHRCGAGVTPASNQADWWTQSWRGWVVARVTPASIRWPQSWGDGR